MPASASSPIAAVADQVGGAELPDPVELAVGLRDVLAEVVDPRQRRGVRHGLVVVLTVAVCAVAAGARSFVAVAEWVADVPDDIAAVLGTDRRCPSESTIRRLLGKLDADRFDVVIGAFVQRLCTGRAPAGRRRVLALDGKTARGSRHTGSDGVEVAGRHLLAVIDQASRVVLGQLAVDGKTSEINRFAPLLDTVIGLDLSGAVVTADALHTQREHVTALHARGAHWVLTVKGNQPRLRRQLAGLPWREVAEGHRSAETGHGRREIRVLKVLTIAAGIEFPHAAKPSRSSAGPPGLRPDRAQGPLAHRDRLRDHRPGPAPGTTRRAGVVDPRALADRERPALGPRRHLRRGPVPDPHRHRTPGHGLATEPGHQPAPPRWGDQHRRRTTTSRPQRDPAPRTTQDQLTLPTPWVLQLVLQGREGGRLGASPALQLARDTVVASIAAAGDPAPTRARCLDVAVVTERQRRACHRRPPGE